MDLIRKAFEGILSELAEDASTSETLEKIEQQIEAAAETSPGLAAALAIHLADELRDAGLLDRSDRWYERSRGWSEITGRATMILHADVLLALNHILRMERSGATDAELDAVHQSLGELHQRALGIDASDFERHLAEIEILYSLYHKLRGELEQEIEWLTRALQREWDDQDGRESVSVANRVYPATRRDQLWMADPTPESIRSAAEVAVSTFEFLSTVDAPRTELQGLQAFMGTMYFAVHEPYGEEFFEPAVQMFRRYVELMDPQLLEPRLGLARALYLRDGHTDEVDRWIDEVKDRVVEGSHDARETPAILRYQLAQTLDAVGRHDELEPVARMVYDETKLHDPERALDAEALFLARGLHANGRCQEATRLYAEALVASQQTVHVDRLAAQLEAARCQRECERYEDAEALLMSLQEELAGSEDATAQRPVFEALVALYEAWSLPEEADHYQMLIEELAPPDGG